LLIPALNALKNLHPDAVITVIAEKRNASAFKICPHVETLLLYDRPKDLLAAIRGNYDTVIDTEQWHRLSAVVARLTRAPVSIGFATNERKKLFAHQVHYSHDIHEADSFLSLFAPLGVQGQIPESRFLSVPEDAKVKAARLLDRFSEKHFVTLFTGASIAERRWGTERFRAVATRLGEVGVSVVVVGGKGDQNDGDRIVAGNGGLNLAGKTSLAETAAVIDKSSILLSGDSGVLHVGVGLGKPTVSLFGPGIADKWAPRGENHIVLNKKLSCSPCTKFGYTPKCSINAKCMQDITVDEVFKAVMTLLARTPHP
jgi:ADP-heptose:LPS heptosyltransferase